MTVPINKKYLKEKIVEAIKLMPFEVKIYREKLNKFKEKEGYQLITGLQGILYKDDKKSGDDFTVNDGGENEYKETKYFLIDCNEESLKVKKGDYLIYENQCWKVIALGENLDIFFNMQVKENEWIKI